MPAAYGIDLTDVSRQAAAAARLEPLLTLNRGRLHRGENWEAFDLQSLALAAINYVISQMGLLTGADVDEVHAFLTNLGAKLSPDRVDPTAEEVATAVMAALRNLDDQGQAYNREYLAFDGDQPINRTVWFRYLTTEQALDGTFIVRASNEAVNIVLGALEVDIEHQQQALLKVLSKQIADRQFAAAQTTANATLTRTKQYIEDIRLKIEDIRRDVERMVWHEDVYEQVLARSETHLDDQLQQNRELFTVVEGYQQQVDDPEISRALANLRELLVGIRGRNLELRTWLQHVADEFRTQLDRQVFIPAQAATTYLSLRDDVLERCLPLPLAELSDTLAHAVASLVGPSRGRVFNLSDLVDRLLVDAEGDGEETAPLIADDEFSQRPGDLHYYSPETVAEAIRRIEALEPGRSTRLSTLLRRAEDPRLADVIWLEAMMRFAPEERHVRADRTLVVARPDGEQLEHDRYSGPDLLLRREPAATPHTDGPSGSSPLDSAGSSALADGGTP